MQPVAAVLTPSNSMSHEVKQPPNQLTCLPASLQMVRLLVHAGADLNADSFSTRVAPAIQRALECSRSEPQDAEILQILIGEFAGVCW
jgi:hypothetical protein